MTPTMYLRFVEQDITEPHPKEPGVSVIKRSRVLQQFWETQNGSEVMGDMFTQIYGTWRNIPLVVTND
jgi:hypothetical protein